MMELCVIKINNMTHAYQITGMTCGSCVARVKSELLKLGDVYEAEVQLNPPQARITMNKHIPAELLQQAVRKAGNYTLSVFGDTSQPEAGKIPAEKASPSYFPIYLIFGYIAGASFLVQAFRSSFSWMEWMHHFMAGFFFVFSFFKFLNLKGFADGYRSYDLVAKAIPTWGYIYPFVELGLAIAWLTGFQPLITGIVTFSVMGISTVGVVRSLLKKQEFQCACLGTIIKLPLSKVTLFEDLLMVVMSAIMFILLF